jgi:hypothetical protein
VTRERGKGKGKRGKGKGKREKARSDKSVLSATLGVQKR